MKLSSARVCRRFCGDRCNGRPSLVKLTGYGVCVAAGERWSCRSALFSGIRPLDDESAENNAAVQRMRRWWTMAGEHWRILDGPMQAPINVIKERVKAEAQFWSEDDPKRKPG